MLIYLILLLSTLQILLFFVWVYVIIKLFNNEPVETFLTTLFWVSTLLGLSAEIGTLASDSPAFVFGKETTIFSLVLNVLAGTFFIYTAYTKKSGITNSISNNTRIGNIKIGGRRR